MQACLVLLCFTGTLIFFKKNKTKQRVVVLRPVSLLTKAISLEYYINLVNKAVEVIERINSSFGGTSNVGKMLSNSIACCREILLKRKRPSMWQTLLWFYLKELPQPPQPSATTNHISQQVSTLRQGPPLAKRLQLTQGSDDG